MLRVHVIPEGRSWAVRVLGESVAVYREQWQAAQAAHVHAEMYGGGQVLIRDAAGAVERTITVPARRRYF